MSKRLKFDCWLSYVALCAALILLSACGGSGGRGDGSSGTGSISLRLEIADYQDPSVIQGQIDCEASGIETIEAQVFDAFDVELVTGGPWDCEAHQGTITDVPAGTNRKVAVLCKDSGGSVLYRGERSGIVVIAGQTTSAGTIVAEPFTPTLLAPEDESLVPNGGFSFQWSPVTGAVGYWIQVSQDSGFTTTIIDDFTTSTIYMPSGLWDWKTYYWQVHAADTGGDLGAGSEIWSFTAVPGIIGSVDTPGSASGVYVSGSYAYMACGGSGLQVIDISDAADPTIVSSVDTSGEAGGVYVSGSYAYVVDGLSGLQVIDNSDPDQTIVGWVDTPGWGSDVYVSGSYAYVADGDYGLQVIDISDAANPTIAGSVDTAGWAVGVYVSGSYAYVADGEGGGGLQVIDISDPENPAITGSVSAPGSAFGVYVSGSYAYMACGGSGLQVIDISGPANPTIAGSVDTPGSAFGVYVSGYAYVADGGSGLQVIDISDPANPTIVGSVDTPGYAYDVYPSGPYVYVADGGSGLQVTNPPPY